MAVFATKLWHSRQLEPQIMTACETYARPEKHEPGMEPILQDNPPGSRVLDLAAD
jgi:hypothetical protein